MKSTRANFLPLRHRADYRTLVFLTLLCALYFVQWTGLLRHWLLFIFTCVFAFSALVIRHNHLHCRTFSNRHWNEAFAHLLGICTGQSTAIIIAIHNERHHGHCDSERDCVRSSLVNFRWNWLNLLAFSFIAIREVRRTKPSDIARWKQREPLLHRRVMVERLVVWSFVILLVLLDWKATAVYFGIPWIISHWCIVTINLLQHQGCDKDSAFDHSRNVTGRFINCLLFNNGYHTAHHLRPALHWSQLPEFHRRQVEPYMRKDLNEQSLLLATWRRFFAGRKQEEIQ